MKNWLKIMLFSFLLFAVLPMSAKAEGKNNLTVGKDQVQVSLSIPEGKTGAITSLRLQLLVTVNSGTMDAPSFAFHTSLKSEIKDAAIIPEGDGSYLVDLILSGKKSQDIFGNSETADIGTLSVKPTSKSYEVKVEMVGEMDDSDKPVIRYVDANGMAALTAPLADTEPVLVKSQEEEKPGPGPDPGPSHEVFTKTPALSASVKDKSKSVTFSWTQIKGADGYVLYEVNGKKNTQVKVLSGAGTTKYVKSYSYGTKHTFKIRAFKNSSSGTKTYGNYSSAVNVVICPDKVKSLSAQYKSSSNVEVTWKKASGASGYQIYRSTKKSGKYTLVKTISKGGTTKATIKHKAGTVYYYKIRAYATKPDKKPVYGNYSTAVAASTKAPKVSASVKSKKVTLKWKKIPRAAGYRIYRCKTKSGKYKLVKTLTKASKVKFTEKLPSGSKTWYYKVCAFEKQKSKKVNGASSAAKKVKAK
ncbi:hypothetical protein AALC25_12745 [Lachnospiraceae bacterium 29-84]